MDEKLIEAMARAIDNELPEGLLTDDDHHDLAQAALGAIAAAGYAVVPVEMTDAMERAQRLEFARYITDEKADIKAASRSAHKAMLAAALVGRE